MTTFRRSYEGTREASAPWTKAVCPACQRSSFAPPLPSNMGPGRLAMSCEHCGQAYIVKPDGGTVRIENRRPPGPRVAVRGFETSYGDVVQATLAAPAVGGRAGVPRELRPTAGPRRDPAARAPETMGSLVTTPTKPGAARLHHPALGPILAAMADVVRERPEDLPDALALAAYAGAVLLEPPT